MEEIKVNEEVEILKEANDEPVQAVKRSIFDILSVGVGIIGYIYYPALIINTRRLAMSRRVPATADLVVQRPMKNTFEFSLNNDQSLYWGLGIIILGIVLGIIGGIINKRRKLNKKSLFMGLKINVSSLILITLFVLSLLYSSSRAMIGKPVIYLYPQRVQETKVELAYDGKLEVTYPKYNDSIKGWDVTAYPDGKIVNHADGKEYSYIFWEAKANKQRYDMSKGFVVKGEDTEVFLQNTLSKMGLTPKEYNEFIVYWLPRMQNNKYNIIHFADKEYTDTAPLNITPKPDSMLRVFMVFKPTNNKVNVEPQEIKSFERKGFSVIEWGGTELEN